MIILTTIDSKKAAKKLSQNLLKKNLAACINLIKAKSFYLWEGKFCKDREILMIIKSAKPKKTMKFIKKNHPYELAELVNLSPKFVEKEYKKWIKQSKKEKNVS